jgi:hypothetical protein
MATEPGWYPDPSGGPGQIYWDGHAWQTPPTPPPGYVHPPQPASGAGRTTLVKFGLGAAVVLVLLVSAIHLFGGSSSPSAPSTGTVTQPASSNAPTASGSMTAEQKKKKLVFSACSFLTAGMTPSQAVNMIVGATDPPLPRDWAEQATQEAQQQGCKDRLDEPMYTTPGGG